MDSQTPMHRILYSYNRKTQIWALLFQQQLLVLQEEGFSVELFWTLAHIRVEGNEYADKVVKEAMQRGKEVDEAPG